MDALVGGARATARRHIAEPPAYSLTRYVEHIMEIADRLWSNVKKQDGDSCWPWLGARIPRPRTGEPGYGCIKIGGKKGKLIYTHRLAWEVTYGPIPDGLCVLHRCDNTQCARPSHLFLGTKDDNNKDMAAKGRWRNQYKDNPPTHCKRGHAFTVENTRLGSHGERVCRTCAAMWMREKRATTRKEKS